MSLFHWVSFALKVTNVTGVRGPSRTECCDTEMAWNDDFSELPWEHDSGTEKKKRRKKQKKKITSASGMEN